MKSALVQRINSYFAILLITIVGAGASLIIIHVAYTNAPSFTLIVDGQAYTTDSYSN